MNHRYTCPGSQTTPASVPYHEPGHDPRAICPRCGQIQRVRLDGTLRLHRADPAQVKPAIFTRGGLPTYRRGYA